MSLRGPHGFKASHQAKAWSSSLLPWPWSLPAGHAKNKASFSKPEFINVTTKALMKTSRLQGKPYGLKPLAPHGLVRKARLCPPTQAPTTSFFRQQPGEQSGEQPGERSGEHGGSYGGRREITKREAWTRHQVQATVCPRPQHRDGVDPSSAIRPHAHLVLSHLTPPPPTSPRSSSFALAMFPPRGLLWAR